MAALLASLVAGWSLGYAALAFVAAGGAVCALSAALSLLCCMRHEAVRRVARLDARPHEVDPTT